MRFRRRRKPRIAIFPGTGALAAALLFCFAAPTIALAQQVTLSQFAEGSAKESIASGPASEPATEPVVEKPVVESYRLRVFWGDGPLAKWSGRLTISEGRLEKLHVLSATDAGQFDARLEGAAVEISQAQARDRGALDITASGPRTATLRLELAQSDAVAPETFDIPLDEVARTPYRRRLGENGASLLVHRAEADRLRVEVNRQQLLFAPGEELKLSVTAALPELSPGSPFDLLVDLLPGRGGDAIWSAGPQRLSAPVEGFARGEATIPMPSGEGVYSVRVTAVRPPGSVKMWLPGSTGSRITERRFQVVVFDPSRQPETPASWRLLREIDPTTTRWWDRLPKWVWLRRAPWLPEGPLGSGQADIVPHAGGRVVQLAAAGEGPPAWQAYPLPVGSPGRPYLVEVDYPADQPQQLVVSVMDQDNLGAAGPLGASADVTVSEWGGSPTMRTVRRLIWPQSRSPLLVLSNGDDAHPARYGHIRVMAVDEQQAVAVRKTNADRWMLANLDGTNLPSMFNASHGGRPEHEDWLTFQETATRLGDWLTASGRDGAVVTVASPAGTLYPSRALATLKAADRELVATGVDDLPQKDALELLYREFDRRGLKLVAQVRKRDAAGDAKLLPPIAKELANRYGRHASFAGAATSYGDLASRTDQTTAVIAAIAEAVAADGASRRLLVLLQDLAEAESAAALLPRLDSAPRAGDPLAALGVNGAVDHPGVAFVLPRFVTGPGGLSTEASRLQINSLVSTASPPNAVGVVAPARWQRLADYEAASPFGAGRTSGLLQITPAGDATLEAFAPLLAEGGPRVVLDGGPAPALLLDHRERTLRETLRRLPPAEAPARAATQQPIAVRAVDQEDGSLLQIANPSPWPAEARVTVRTPRDSRMVDVTAPPGAAPVRYGAGEHVLRVSLDAYQVQLLQFDQSGVEPIGLRGSVSKQASEQLEARLADLRNRNLNARSEYTAGPSPSFEGIGPDGRVADWGAIATPGGGSVSITKQAPADGQQAVRLTSTTGSAGIQSRPFAMPATGQLAIVFSVRTEQLSDHSQLRVSFEQSGGGYRSFTVMDRQQLGGAEGHRAKGEWSPYVLAVDDLPLGPDKRMRVRFDLTGGGQVDVDNLKLYDLVFPLDFLGGEATKQRLALLKPIHAAESALEEGRVNDCRRQLEGYWPRFIREYTPLVTPAETSVAARPAPPVAPPPGGNENEAEPDKDDEPGFSDRLRGYLPSFMRF